MRHGKAEAQEDGVPSAAHHTDKVFRMQLKPNVGPEFKPHLQALNKEYATRYLEHLGIAPAKATLDLVQRNVPLTEQCITTTLRAKGHVNDELLLTAPPVPKTFKIPKVIHAHAILQLGLTNQETASLQPEGSKGVSHGLLEGSAAVHDAQVPGTEFRTMAAKYLHPFQLDTNLTFARLEELMTDMRPDSAEGTQQHTQKRGDCKRSSGPKRSNATHTSTKDTPDRGAHSSCNWDPELLKQEICEELLFELNATPEVVLTLLAPVEAALVSWFQHQAPETLKGRLTAQEFKNTLESLTNDIRVNFFITLFNFMHQEFVKGSPGYPKHLENKGASGGPTLTRQHSGISRSSSFRAPSMSLTSMASMSNALQTSYTQSLDKYDLGYKHWMREKKIQRANADGRYRPGPARKSTTGLKSQQSEGRPKSAGIKRTVSFSSHANNPQLPHSRSPPRNDSLTSLLSQNTLDTHMPQSALRKRSSLRFAPNLDNKSPSRRLEFSPSLNSQASLKRTVSNGGWSVKGGSVQRGVYGGSEGGHLAHHAQACTLSEATKRSMQHLQSVKVLQEAVAQASSGPMRITSKDEEQLQQARLFVLQKEFAHLYSQSRHSRAGMFFTLPVFLVTARLIVNMLFTGLYRLWVKTQEGYDAVQKMDQALEHLFDPHGYLQRNLSILQSSAQAVAVMAKFPHKSHEPERLHFSDVSPLLRASMVDPGSSEARRMLVRGAHDKLTRDRFTKRGGAANGNQQRGDTGAAAEPAVSCGPQQLFASTPGPIKTQLTAKQREVLFRLVREGIDDTGMQMTL